jgi:hypothetical protein
LKPKKRKNKGSHKAKNENFNDIDEFDMIEEENYLENMLEQKKLEDDNLEVYLIEAQEVKDLEDDDAINDAYNKDIGYSSDEINS